MGNQWNGIHRCILKKQKINTIVNKFTKFDQNCDRNFLSELSGLMIRSYSDIDLY
jgi:hypothetical protein